MTLVRVGFTNCYGSVFHWDFQCRTNDHCEAIEEAVKIFMSGLTFDERWDAWHTLDMFAHSEYLPERKLPMDFESATI